MYVCICNAIADGAVKDAIANGSQSVESVYAACGVVPQCGTCGELIQEMIDTHRATTFSKVIPAERVLAPA